MKRISSLLVNSDNSTCDGESIRLLLSGAALETPRCNAERYTKITILAETRGERNGIR